METPAHADEHDREPGSHGLHFEIRPATADEVRTLRRDLLRPGAPESELVWDGDDHPDTLHVATFVFDVMCGIATVHREAPPWDPDHEHGWRLRGMATSRGVRRRGVGTWMLATCMQHAWEQGGTLLWCNARTEASGFYRVLGFEPHGDRFDIPSVGEHIRMWRELAT
jgi:GNAT superfamily N-acetyltransferase